MKRLISSCSLRTSRRLCSLGLWKGVNNPRLYSSDQPSLELPPVVEISREIQESYNSFSPVVALETTIYTHGFPYPDNIALALNLEDIVRSHGAIPATIGLYEGVAKVGLSTDEIVKLCTAAGKPETRKVSRRDIPYILGMGIAGKKLFGGTTISGTMYLARLAGIEVFGTGGLGGVHRGGENTMDVSADLTELGRTNVAVISSGCKSFLDIPRTLEYLETQGVMVATFADGRTGDIDVPAFYTRDSGIKSPMVVENAHEAASIIFAHRIVKGLKGQFPRNSGLFFANPIPKEFSIPKEDVDGAINQAVREAAEQGIRGHANTPFILSRIKDLTMGKSLPANRALIESNVAMAAKVAVELAKYKKDYNTRVDAMVKFDNEQKVAKIAAERAKSRGKFDPLIEAKMTAKAQQRAISRAATDVSEAPTPGSVLLIKGSPEVAVFGSVALDIACDYQPVRNMDSLDDMFNASIEPQRSTSNVAAIRPSVGGVGHNVALAAHRVMGPGKVQLFSVVADDLAGKQVLEGMEAEGLETSGIQIVPRKLPTDSSRPYRTAQYVAMNDARKDLVTAMADMEIFHLHDYFYGDINHITQNLKWAIIDANSSRAATRKLIKSLRDNDTGNGPLTRPYIAYEPVSAAKSGEIFKYDPNSNLADRSPLPVFPNHAIHLSTPNRHELAAMFNAAKEANLLASPEWWTVLDSFGIPSSGARDRFVQLTNAALTDEGIPTMSVQLLPFIPTILTKLGEEGVLMTQLLRANDPRLKDPDHARYILSRCQNSNEYIGGVYMRLFPAAERVDPMDVVSVNGVGDTFLGVLVAGLARGVELDEELITLAQRGAVMTLKSEEAVCPELGILGAEMMGEETREDGTPRGMIRPVLSNNFVGR